MRNSKTDPGEFLVFVVAAGVCGGVPHRVLHGQSVYDPIEAAITRAGFKQVTYNLAIHVHWIVKHSGWHRALIRLK